MVIRLKRRQTVLLYQAFVFFSFFVFLIEYLVLYHNAEWITTGTWDSYAQEAVTTPLTSVLRVLVYGLLFSVMMLYFPSIKIRLSQMLMIVVLVMFGVGWTIHALFIKSIKVVVYDSATPVFWICAIFMLVGYEDKVWDTFVRCLPVFGGIFLSLSVWALFEYNEVIGIMGAQRVTSSALLYFFIYAFWAVAASVFVNDYAIKKYGNLMILVSAVFVLMAVMFRSRGWMLQTLAMMIYVTIRNGIRWKDKRQAALFYVFAFVVAVYVFSDMLFYLSGPIRERMFADSRSHQFEVFFQQVTMSELLIGKGIGATYSFSGVHTSYRYFDNQFILELFRYGLVPIALYTLLVLRPVFKAVVRFDWDLLRRSIVLIMWLLAMGGISVYFNLNTNMHCLVMNVVIGRLNCLCSRNVKERI